MCNCAINAAASLALSALTIRMEMWAWLRLDALLRANRITESIAPLTPFASCLMQFFINTAEALISHRTSQATGGKMQPGWSIDQGSLCRSVLGRQSLPMEKVGRSPSSWVQCPRRLFLVSFSVSLFLSLLPPSSESSSPPGRGGNLFLSSLNFVLSPRHSGEPSLGNSGNLY